MLALGMASCDDDFNKGIPQVNPQETVMSAGGITVDFGSALQNNTLDLNQYQDEQIPVINLALTDAEAAEIPAGTEIEFVMQLASKADYSDAAELPVVAGSVACADWDNYFRSKLGRSPKAKDNYVRFAAYMLNAGQRVRVGSPDTWFAAKQISVTPIPMDFTIEEEYYLIGTINGWSLDKAYPFSHSAQDVYDDPVFSITVEISEEQAAEGWWWKVAPASCIDNNSWTEIVGTVVDGDSALEGALMQGFEKVDENGNVDKQEANAGCFKEAGTYLFTINMMDMTYSFKKLEYLYTPGNSNGWNHAAAQKLLFNSNSGKYEGLAVLDGEFKFTSQADWAGTNYGAADTEGTLSTDGGAGNLVAPERALYWCSVDVANLTYTITPITSLGAIGDMNGWSSQEAFTASADLLTWSGDVTFGAADEWKIRANDDWGINWGGEMNNLSFDAPNLPSPGAGTYTVTFDATDLPYKVSVVKK